MSTEKDLPLPPMITRHVLDAVTQPGDFETGTVLHSGLCSPD